MTKKISNFFKIEPKSSKTEEINSIVPKVRECQVILKDIKHQFSSKNFKLFDEVSVNRHKSCENEKNVCKFCGKKMHSDMKEHIKNVHPTELDLPYCELFDSRFLHNRSLDIYVKKKDPDGQNVQFECDFDGKIFKTMRKLTSHMQSHFSLVKCKVCDKMMKQSSIYFHMRNFHAIDRKFQCKICTKNYKSKISLATHQKNHNKQFVCEICKKMFPSNGLLNCHIRICHENADSFECEVCEKKFNRKNNLKSHQKIHDKNRPKTFKCERCDFATDYRKDFNKHQKSHERQDKKFAAMKNPLKCEKCPTFHRSQAMLKQHMKQVHPKNLFQCDLCGRFIKIKADLTKHIKIHIRKLN